jgi:hypothetical protein
MGSSLQAPMGPRGSARVRFYLVCIYIVYLRQINHIKDASRHTEIKVQA